MTTWDENGLEQTYKLQLKITLTKLLIHVGYAINEKEMDPGGQALSPNGICTIQPPLSTVTWKTAGRTEIISKEAECIQI